MKIIVSSILVCALSLQAGFFSDDKATFNEIYPTPFYKTTSGKWIIGTVTVVGLTAATIATGGAAAIPGATSLGTLFGTTWTGALATLGGGTLASGGFGMAGGAMVLGVTTEVAFMGLSNFIPSSNYHGKYTTIKIPLPEVGSKDILKIYDLIDDTKEQYNDGDINRDTYGKILYSYYNDALRKIDKDNSYDLINKAIMEFNLGKFDESSKSIIEAEGHFKVKSYIYYHKALLSLAKDNDTNNAIAFLEKSISEEDDRLKPYILLSQIYLDENKLVKAFNSAQRGLKYYDDDSFELNWLAGNIKYKLKEYSNAIKYYENALSNITENTLEAECKVMVANSFYNMQDYKESKDWYEKALDEVDETKYATNIEKMYVGTK